MTPPFLILPFTGICRLKVGFVIICVDIEIEMNVRNRYYYAVKRKNGQEKRKEHVYED